MSVGLVTLVVIAGVASSCAHRPGVQVAPRHQPRVLVCDGERRELIQQALSIQYPNAVYSWADDRCRRARLSADYLASACSLGQRPCELPEYIDGTPVADGTANEELVFVLTRLTHEIHRERAWKMDLVRDQSRPVRNARDTNMVPYDRDVETPGLSGPVYLIEQPTGRLVGALALRQTTPSGAAAALVKLVDARPPAGGAEDSPTDDELDGYRKTIANGVLQCFTRPGFRPRFPVVLESSGTEMHVRAPQPLSNGCPTPAYAGGSRDSEACVVRTLAIMALPRLQRAPTRPIARLMLISSRDDSSEKRVLVFQPCVGSDEMCGCSQDIECGADDIEPASSPPADCKALSAFTDEFRAARRWWIFENRDRWRRLCPAGHHIQLTDEFHTSCDAGPPRDYVSTICREGRCALRVNRPSR